MICPKCGCASAELFTCEEGVIVCLACACDLEESSGPFSFSQLNLERNPSLEAEITSANDTAFAHVAHINSSYDSLISLLQRQRRILISLIEHTRLQNIAILTQFYMENHAPRVDEPALGLVVKRKEVEEREGEGGEELMYVSGNRGVRFDLKSEKFSTEVTLNCTLPEWGSYITWESNLFYSGGKASDLCYLFQLSIGSLLYKCSMSTPRTGHRLIKHHSSLFIFGGQDFDQALSLCEVFNLHNHSLTKVGASKHARYNLAAVLHRDKIYLAGFAQRGAGIKNEIEVFDPVTYEFSVIRQPSLNINCSMVGFRRDETVYFLKPTEVVHFSPGAGRGKDIATTKITPIFKKGSLKAQTSAIVYGHTAYFLTVLEGVPSVFSFDLHTFVAQKVATLRS